MGALFGLLGALAGEVAARCFFNYGKNHIDPPAVSLVITNTIISFLCNGIVYWDQKLTDYFR